MYREEIRLIRCHSGYQLMEITFEHSKIIDYSPVASVNQCYSSIEEIEDYLSACSKALHKPILDITDDEGRV